jgi:dienelactone hydrolase
MNMASKDVTLTGKIGDFPGYLATPPDGNGPGVVDIQFTITRLREITGGKAGNLGFCMGGLLSFLTAAHTVTDASACYHPETAHGRTRDHFKKHLA